MRELQKGRKITKANRDHKVETQPVFKVTWPKTESYPGQHPKQHRKRHHRPTSVVLVKLVIPINFTAQLVQV